MKKLKFALFIFFLTYSIPSLAQVQKGDWLTGGTATMDLLLGDDNDFFSINLSPNLMYFLSDRVAVGGSVGLEFAKVASATSISVGILPMARYYFNSAEQKKLFFLEAKVGINAASIMLSSNRKTETADIQYGFGPGLAFFIAENISVDALLSFNRIGGDFGRSNLNLNIGFQVYLSKP